MYAMYIFFSSLYTDESFKPILIPELIHIIHQQ